MFQILDNLNLNPNDDTLHTNIPIYQHFPQRWTKNHNVPLQDLLKPSPPIPFILKFILKQNKSFYGKDLYN